MKFIDKLAWIHIVDKKILSTRSKGIDTYYIPGGKRAEGETDEDALIREIKEELTVDLIPNTINYLGTFKAQAHGKANGIIVQMTCYTADYTGHIKADSEIDEVVMLSYVDKDKSSPVDKIIFDWLYKQSMLD